MIENKSDSFDSDEFEMSKANATDESFINVEEEEEEEVGESANENQCDTKYEEDNSTQFVSDDLGENKNYRRNRFASTDCSGLQILSEIANSREKIISAVKRIERSKSLDSNIRLELSRIRY